MKRFFFTMLLSIVVFGIAAAQAYNNPESIVYDSIDNRYFISNKGGNSIVQLNSEGVLSNFVNTGLNEPKGLLIVGDTLISVNSTSIQGYLLADASQVVNVSIAGSSFMNDAISDNNGQLYISDSNNDVIYKLNLSDGTYSILINSGINPNGLLYNKKDNSLLICSWGSNAKIQSFNLNDSSLTTLITTKLSNLDGLARDNCGNIYVSSWGKNSVYVYDSLFLNPPTVISSGHNGPADIVINENEQILAVPNFNSNTIKLINLGKQCFADINYVSPLDNSIDLDDSISIDWDDIDGVSGYNLQYSKDSLFATSVITLTTTRSDTIIKGLDLNTKYFWRIRTIGGNYKSIFNKPWRFTTKEIVSSLHNIGAQSDYLVYPNPSNGYITVKGLKNYQYITSYLVIDASGQTIKQGDLTSQIIDVSDIDKGIYFIRLNSYNNRIITKKIILE